MLGKAPWWCEKLSPDIRKSIPGCNSGGGGGGDGVVQFVTNVLSQDYTPIMQMIGDVSYFIGLCFLIIFLSRLHRHGQNAQQMMHRVSPLATGMYLVSSVVLISFIPWLQMLSNSFFYANTVLSQGCNSNAPLPSFFTSTNSFCPEMAYVSDIQNASQGDQLGDAIKYMAFGTLMIVGVISFIRGMMLLVRIGEGQGQGTTAKAMTHIFAGLVAVNADNAYYLFMNVLSSAASGTDVSS